MAVVLVELLRHRKLFAAVMVTVPGAVVWLGWKTATVVLAARASTDFHPLSLDIVNRNLPRITTVTEMLAAELTKPGNWSLLWGLFPVALICLARFGWKKTPGNFYSALPPRFCFCPPPLS